MNKIVKSAAVLLLATSVFAQKPSLHSHANTTNKVNSVTHKATDIPSLNGLYINVGSGYGFFHKNSKDDEKRNSFGIGGGMQLRYQIKHFICSAGLGMGWHVYALKKGVSKEDLKGFSGLFDLSLGYQLGRQSFAAYAHKQRDYTSTGAQHSYLFGKAVLLQTRLGVAFAHKEYRGDGKVCPGLDVGIHVAYKVC